MTPAALALACLSLNVYYEAGDEPTQGKYAVALVTINRTLERDLDVCDVVFQPDQFSWANNALDENGMMRRDFMPDMNTEKWRSARHVAKNVLDGWVTDFTGGATYFYADYIAMPLWAHKMYFTGKYGSHYFYRIRA